MCCGFFFNIINLSSYTDLDPAGEDSLMRGLPLHEEYVGRWPYSYFVTLAICSWATVSYFCVWWFMVSHSEAIAMLPTRPRNALRPVSGRVRPLLARVGRWHGRTE